VHACGYGAGRRARCRCVAERATALKARVLHARAWNSFSHQIERVAAWPHEGHLDLTADGAIKGKAHRRTRR